MSALRNGFFYGAGLAVLALASLRHRVGGYRRPTEFSASDWPRAIEHVRDIVLDWNAALLRAQGRGFAGLDVLELGPGATLGTGLLLTALGARTCRAIDRFSLAETTPRGFYRALAEADLPAGVDRQRLRAAVAAMERGEDGPVSYRPDPDFDITRAAQGRTFDVIVSNAAFEHFTEIDAVVAQVSAVARPGAAFIAMIDFQTHSRWIRTCDPNSIYRYGPRLWRALSFPGQPNRCRPADYLDALDRHGWISARLHPVDVARPDYLAWSRPGLASDFGKPNSRMEVLTGIVQARKGPGTHTAHAPPPAADRPAPDRSFTSL